MTAITLSRHHVGMELAGAVNRMAAALLVSVSKDEPKSRTFIRPQTVPAFSDWLAELSDEANAVRAYCEDQKIMSALVVAVAMAKRRFSNGKSFFITLEEDPDFGRKALAVNVNFGGTVDDAVDSYNKFSEEWIATVSWPKRGMIRLYYNFV
jgi:hypothetical protein